MNPVFSNNSFLSQRPQPDEFANYYKGYIDQIADGQCEIQLVSQIEELVGLMQDVNENQANTIHAPYTWTIKQVIGHMIDAERIFSDRLLRFSSGEQQPQPGFDQDAFVTQQDYQTPLLKDLVEELVHCRQANCLLIRRLKAESFSLRGTASGYPVSVRALIWMLVGHVRHHLQIVKRRISKA